jgi:hypothetical protein
MRSRRAAGWTLKRIARGEGLSHQRVSVIVRDVEIPSRGSARCKGCHTPIERRSTTGMCRSCLTAEGWRAQPQRWTQEAVVEAFLRFNERYGHGPRATDLSPAMARKTGRPELAERFHRDGDMPSLHTVTKRFGGLNLALEAAGLPTRKPGVRLTT